MMSYRTRRRNPGYRGDNPERQFWEKVFLLRVENYRPGWGDSASECAAVDADKALQSWKRRFPDRLRDAAPKLLEACKEALGAFENNNAIDWNDLAEAIEAAEGPKPESIQ